ncbi:MAG: S8 family serine peptidase [Candidatus Nanoarchaeia archaeon]|nr:S8 family serine peptidase [Candidatus Nanoarchaeia archaeon]
MKRLIFGIIGIVLLAFMLPLIFASNEYEPDNVWQNATTILTNGSRQAHTFEVAGDVDYVNFSAVAGVQYVIETYGSMDTQITLYNSSMSQLDYNNNIEDTYQLNSRIVFDVEINDTYYVNISLYSGSTGSYNIGILEQGRLIPSLVSHTSASNVTKNRVFSFTSSVTCLSADCYNLTATLDPEVNAVKKEITKGKAEGKIYSMLEEQKKVGVIVIMKQKGVKAKGKKEAFSAAEYSALSDKGFEKRHEYTLFNGFSGKVTKESLAELENNPNVEAVYYDAPVHVFVEQNIQQINADKAWATQVDGINITGVDETICIIDTGINYSHSDFGGCVRITPVNINDGSCLKVVGGYDYVNGDSDPYDDHNYLGGQGHGSHVAGIAASQGPGYEGVAPDAKIVAIKALDNTGSGWESDIAAGIDWCVANATKLNITAISMSLGGTFNSSFHCNHESLFKTSIDAAVLVGVPVFVASGNIPEYTDRISSPACIENATSVGAVDSTDSLRYMRSRVLDLLAPGVSIEATKYTGGHVAYTGTSMSTPHAAALALLLKQYAKLKFSRNLTAEELKHNIITSGEMIYDSSSKLSFPRIDALSGINSKGIIPTTAGAKPFYSLTPNPHNASCLSHIVKGDICTTTWEVNVTGDANDTYAFFVIYTTDYKRNDSAKVNLTISSAIPVSLNAPENALISNNISQIFNCSVSNSQELVNITLYGNFNSSWHANRTANITGNSNSSAWQFNLSEGSYEWNCYACTSDRCDFASSNFSLSIDTAPPSYYGLSYTALIELGDEQSISLNISDSHLSYANISFSSVNYTMSNSSSNFSYSYTPMNNGTINFTIYAFDSAGNSNSTSASFIANDTSDEPRVKSVSFSSAVSSGDRQTITAYIYDQWQPLTVYLNHNGTNITMPNSSMANYSYSWNETGCGTITYKLYSLNSQNYMNLTTGTFTANNCCGNGVCDGSDTCSSCPADCGACAATTSSGGGGGGGGGSVSALSNYASFIVNDVSPSNPAVVSIANNEIPVTSVTIDVASDIPQARVQVTALKEQPSSVSSVSFPVYKYLDISTGIQAKDIVNAEVVFNIPSTWLLENGILKDDVVLLRFNEESWIEMPTSYLMKKEDLHYYTASVGGFSVFAISKKAVEAKEPEPVIEASKIEEITASAVEVPDEEQKAPEPWYAMKAPWISLLAVLFAACIVEAIYLSHFIHIRHKNKK